MLQDITYKTIKKNEIQNEYRTIVGDFLKKQNKVIGDLYIKADRCKLICIAYSEEQPVAMGAIKPKIASDFSKQKANLLDKASEFDWELGYIYTDDKFTKRGITRKITYILLKEYGSDNLMASTEINDNPGMVKILIENGFKHYGSLWKSHIHKNDLGLPWLACRKLKTLCLLVCSALQTLL
ncbi:hypothetical protein [Flavivirga sp. 57AJ16]|uniref:hypothetical protein n=1 Tax=Flavivirga sp. 57AJ16 TaxID=3025307 RepID=UPI002366BA37|nr:hypothetical protein [Flavivirga sp. 57AJ16]MDD7888001.1 hypothetical protein [Flavivirga sp. 57AJ16]